MSAASRLLERFPALANLRASRERSIPYVQQTMSTDCGAACLAMLLSYHGKKMRLDDVREVMGVGRDGADAMAILRAGRWFGLRGRGVQIDRLEDLKYLPRGSVLHWGFNHFVVFEKLTTKGAEILDPATGRRPVSHDDLDKHFTGVALTFEPAEDFEPADERTLGAMRYVRELLSQSRTVSRSLVLSVLLQILALATPLLTGVLVDRVVPRGDRDLLLVLAVGVGGIVVFHFLSSLVRAHLLLELRTHFDAKVTLEFLEHLVDLPYAFFQRRSAGDLIMRLNSHSTIREILTSNALSAVLDGVLVMVYLALLWIADWRIGFLVLVLAALRVILFLLVRTKQRDLMSESLQAQALSRGYQVQMLNGIETLKAVGAEERAVEHWSNLFVDELNVSIARGRLNAIFDSLINALGVASPLMVLSFGGWLVIEGDLSLGTMLALNALAAGFLTPISTLIQTGVQFLIMGSYLERINDVMETPKEQSREDVSAAPPLSGRIVVDNVSFRYSPLSQWVTRDISLDIEPGQMIALVGPSGAGKSTLANLLLGLYEPTSGRILFDGHDLASLDLRSVRRQLGIVSQQPYLFGSSIRKNIALSDPGLSLPQCTEAAKKAQIHDEIRAMPMGYDTMVADGGASLSGGQRQRLALARALATKPAILLLDEATSQLDSVTESNIQRELERLRATRIVIAHRLSTVKKADLILVMVGGRIVERGRHDDLLASGGAYARLVQAQLERKERQ